MGSFGVNPIGTICVMTLPGGGPDDVEDLVDAFLDEELGEPQDDEEDN